MRPAHDSRLLPTEQGLEMLAGAFRLKSAFAPDAKLNARPTTASTLFHPSGGAVE